MDGCIQPKIELVTAELVDQILAEAFQLLMDVGVKVMLPEARELLAEAGATVDEENQVVRIPEPVVRKSLITVPHESWLHNQAGQPTVRYGGDAVHFDPGSSGVCMLNPETLEHYSAETADLVKLIKAVFP